METLTGDAATGQKLTISTAIHVIHGGTSLQLSDGGPSPVLVAHPGSPVDISCRRRPSLTASCVPVSYRSHAEFMDIEMSPPTGGMERSIRRSGVAVKRSAPEMEGGVTSGEQTPTRLRNSQMFFLPEKVPDNEQIEMTTTPIPAQDGSENSAMQTSWFDFDFGFDSVRLPAATLGNDSNSSLTSATTGISGPNNRRFSRGALTVDTSVASSATSMASSDASIYSAVTNTTDIYGWEEELDRRMSVGNRGARAPGMTRRATSGGRITSPRVPGDLYSPPYKRVDVKRKSLLHRVLNMRRGLEESCPPGPPAPECPTTSA
jgi:hypothetical protein